MKRLLPLSLCLSLLAQQPKPDEPFVLRSTTKLVQVNVVAVDKKGEPVSDLTDKDFEIIENGKNQRVAYFGMVRSGALAAKPLPIQPNIFSNRFAKSGLPASVTVILLDGLNTSWEDQNRARNQVVKFLSTIQAEDRIALYSLGRGLRVLHDFTTETSELIAKLDQYRGENNGVLEASALPAGPAIDPAAAGPLSALSTADPGAPTLREAEFNTTARVVNTLLAMEAIASRLAGLPGRKSLIWVSGSFPMTMGFDQESIAQTFGAQPPEKRIFNRELQRAQRLLNHAGVAVYPVDARGLLTGAPTAATRRDPFTPASSQSVGAPNIDAMLEIASKTGGRAFYNRNDIDRAVRIAADDGRVTYTLGYYPTYEPDDKYHQIKVNVNRPGITLRHRQGYFAYRDTRLALESVKLEIAQILWSPLDATGLGLNARVDHNSGSNELEVLIQVEPTNLTLEQKDGRFLGRVDIGFVLRDAEGKSYKAENDTIDLNLTRESYGKVQETGIVYRKRFPLPEKAAFLRIAGRDGASGLAGSLTIPLKNVQSYTPKQPAR